VGCKDEKKKFVVGEKVCIIDGSMVGTIDKVEQATNPSNNRIMFIYYVSVHKKDLGGSVIYEKRASEINKFSEDPR